MQSKDWGFSSSSGSDSDDDRPITKFRRNTQFYQQYQNREFGSNWPHDLPGPSVIPHHLTNGHALNSSVLNGSNGHISINDVSRIPRLDESRILSPTSIIENATEEFVLIKENGKYRPIRIIDNGEILPLRISPNSKMKKIKPKPEPVDNEYHTVREIPLERIDFIDVPKDPRTKKRDDYGDEDNEGLPMPRFWREMALKKAQEENRERNVKLNGSFKRSCSYVREKVLQQNKRISMAGPKRTDPRLDSKNLFGPPRKITSPPNTHNRSQTCSKADQSIFDGDDADNISSGSSSFSSPSESFGSSLPDATDNNYNDHNSTARINELGLDSSESDNDCSFSAFQKRKLSEKDKQPAKKTKYSTSNIQTRSKMVSFKMDFKKKKISPTNKNKSKGNTLFGKPPCVDKEDILFALTDDTDQENVYPNINEIESATEVVANDKVQKVESDHNLKKANNKTHADKFNNLINIIELSSDDATQTQLPNSQTNEIIEIIKTKETKKSNQPILMPIQELECNLSESDESTSSVNSIEQRLAAMISPVKTAAELLIEQNEQNVQENLTDILSERNDEKVESVVNSVEDSGIQTATESPSMEGHVDTISNGHMDTVSSAIHNDKNDTSLASKCVDKETVPPVSNGINDSENKKYDSPVWELVTQTPICEENELADSDSTIVFDSTTLTNMNIDLPDISVNSAIFGPTENMDIDDYLDTMSIDDMGQVCESVDKSNKETTIQSNKIARKPQRVKVLINDYSEIRNVAALVQPNNDAEISDDDYEDDKPCGMDALILPNSNTDRNINDTKRTNCNLCSFQATKGWKQLTKHYVRKHAGKEVSASRLDKAFNPQELMATSFSPLLTETPAGTMIQSLCYMCNEGYKLCSSKWLAHFIAHTGEFEFQCNKCHKEILQDLHKGCNSKYNKRINGPHDFIDNVLYGYVCALCSYVQLSKKNVVTHLENEHQQLITGDENIIEIILLKSTQPADLLKDDKNNPDLLKAKQISTIHDSNRYDHEHFDLSDIVIPSSDSEDGFKNDNRVAPSIDLTLSDEE